jgi:hypothetical protein
MIKEVENQFKVLDKQGIMNKKTKLCKCCDTTENEDGICDTCKLLDDMDKRNRFK